MLRHAALSLLLLASPIAAPVATAQDQGNDNALYYAQILAPDAIRAVQAKLRGAGVYSGPVDGAWGHDSVVALQNFQQTRGLQVTGQMNQATAAVLGLNPAELVTAAGSVAPPSPPAAPAEAPGQLSSNPNRAPVPLSSNALRAVQARLREGGYYTGSVDGVWGPGSQNALLRMQQARGLPITGRIDGASVQALGFDPNAFP